MDEKRPRGEGAARPKDPQSGSTAPSGDDAGAAAPASRCLERLGAVHAGSFEIETAAPVPVVRVVPERIAEIGAFLKNDPECRMTLLSNLSGVDMIALGRPEPRFDVVYHLFGLDTGERITLKAAVAEDGEIPSVAGVWRTANWHEREAWDMFGIRFAGHPDLRRILMPDEFDAFPLRKDFPLEGRAKDHGYWRKPEDDARESGRG